MDVLTLRVSSWAEARCLADELSGWIFRGQEDASWLLSTTLQRAGSQGVTTSNLLLSKIEEQIIQEFRRRAHHFLADPPPPANLIEWQSLIQHYGGPTRLLDFTRSFYVAAFFAVERALTDCAVWCVNHHSLYEAVKSHLGAPAGIDLTPHWEVSHRTAYTAQVLMQRPDASAKRLVFEVQPFRLNERLAVQQGVFLCPISVDFPFMSSLAAMLQLPEESFEKCKTEIYDPEVHVRTYLASLAVIKVVFPRETHHDGLQDLWNMNVNAATLFPGLPGLARSLNYFVQVDNLWHVKYAADATGKDHRSSE